MLTTLTARPASAPARRKSTSAPTRPRRQSSRPTVEALDERLLLSIGATFDPTSGVLNVATDGYNTKASVSVTPWGTIALNDDFYGMRATGTVASKVSKIVFKNNAPSGKTVNFTNLTSIDTDYHSGSSGGTETGGGGTNRYYPGPGISYLVGGSGTNLFYDTTNTLNDYNLGTGDNFLYLPEGAGAAGASHIAYFQNPNNVTPRSQTVVTSGGPTTDRYANPSSLNAAASSVVNASLDATSGALSITGPTGGGFRILSKWTDSYDAVARTHTFRSTATTYLETGLVVGGDHVSIPVTTRSGGLTITVKAPVASVPSGEFSSIAWAGVPLSSSSGSNVLGDFGDKYGFSFSTPGASWGIKLGADLAKTSGLPLLAGIPYLYSTVSTGVSVSYNDSLSAGTTNNGYFVAMDPADPAVYAQVSTSTGVISVGASLHGAIPYTPLLTPQNAPIPRIYGNLYTSAADVALGDLPVAVSGGTIISLDANHDGVLAGLSKGDLKDLLRGKVSVSQLGAAARDVAIGFNGGVSATTAAYGFNLSAKVAQGSAYYGTDPATGASTVAFRVATVNPFAGTKLADIAPRTSVDIGGFLSRRSSGKIDWGFDAYASNSSIAGLDGTELSLEAGCATNSVQVAMVSRGLLGASEFDLRGSVSLATGNFDLTQTSYLGADFKVARGSLTETLHIQRVGDVLSMYVDMSGSFRLGDDANNIYGGFNVRVDVSITMDGGNSRLHFRGRGSAWLGITVAYTSTSGSLGFDVSDNGFRVSILGKRVGLDW